MLMTKYCVHIRKTSLFSEIQKKLKSQFFFGVLVAGIHSKEVLSRRISLNQESNQ